MKIKVWLSGILVCALLGIFQPSISEAADGTLKGTFAYLDPATGAETLLTSAFVYLHNASKPPPMEKYLVKADYILGPSSNGAFSVSVPAGNYYVRILRRKTVTGSARPYGPPEEGDYTWMQHLPITVPSGGVVDLGKKYAVPYAASPVRISGTVKSATGAPLTGFYVRAQTEPCEPPVCVDNVCSQTGNKCGPNKFLALRATGNDGAYTMMLADAGTYYLYTSPCLMPGHNLNDGSRCEFTAASSPVTVKRGDAVTVDIVVP